LVKILILPPGNMLLLALIGVGVRKWWPRTSTWLLVASAVGLFALSTPVGSHLLLRPLEVHPALDPGELPADVEAIVVLGADGYAPAPEYRGDSIGATTLERVRYGAWLHRRTRLPVLTTGGTIRPARTPLGDLMAATMREEYGVPVRWVETRAANTIENARFSAELLRRDGIRSVYVVTHASHMRRSVACFEAMGFDVVAAPTAFTGKLSPIPGDFLPRAKALHDSKIALYEWFGLLWYRVAYL
jgi:uncharacterized SAM-binding protein YcdF (DUF218 family)